MMYVEILNSYMSMLGKYECDLIWKTKRMNYDIECINNERKHSILPLIRARKCTYIDIFLIQKKREGI